MKKTKEFYVYRHDFNNDNFVKFNIFSNDYIEKSIEKLLKEYVTFDDFKEKLLQKFRSEYNSRCEFEFLCFGLFDNCKEYKVSVYDQIVPNIDLIARYIIDFHNKSARKNKIEIK